uniref:Dynein light chain Tctex-type 3 n=2 Tax=Catharus ustulatus TaxID=91951 RepID=A0A8C3UEF5_CATUS
MVWVGRDTNTTLFQPPAMGRDAFRWPRLFRAPSSLAWMAGPASLGNLSQCLTSPTGKNFSLLPNLNLHSQFEVIPPCSANSFAPSFLYASLKHWKAAIGLPQSLLFSRLNNPNSLILSSIPLISLVAASGLLQHVPVPAVPCWRPLRSFPSRSGRAGAAPGASGPGPRGSPARPGPALPARRRRSRAGLAAAVAAGTAAARAGAMEDFHPHNDEMIFNADEAHNIVKECIENVLGKADYNHNKVNQWTAAIVEQSLTHLVKLGKTYKYIVTCAVMQRSGAGLHTASSCFWDTTTDGTCTVRWENRTMNCVVNVFAVAIIL